MADDLTSSEQSASTTQYGVCSNEATNQTDHLRPGSSVSRSIQQALNDAEEWARSQREYLEALGSWQSCMQANGYEFPSSTAAVESVISSPDGDQFRNRWAQAVHDQAIAGADALTLTDVFSAAEVDELRILQDAEVRLAIVDWDCGAGGVPLFNELVLQYLITDG